MRTYVTLFALAALLAATSLLSGDAARAEEDPWQDAGHAPSGVWAVDVRVVRVDPAYAAGAEAASPFPERSGTTIGLAWPEILARLKKRGTTTLLCDARCTALARVKCQLSEERAVPSLGLISEDKNNKQYRSQTVKTGVSYEQTLLDGRLTYQAHINDALTTGGPKQPPAQYTVRWTGAHPPLNGQTLVLVHRQQIARPPPAEARALEHYAFITCRFVPSK
jgi:hypothetical protein